MQGDELEMGEMGGEVEEGFSPSSKKGSKKGGSSPGSEGGFSPSTKEEGKSLRKGRSRRFKKQKIELSLWINHTKYEFNLLCTFCTKQPAVCHCPECPDFYCKACDGTAHKTKKRQGHERTALSKLDLFTAASIITRAVRRYGHIRMIQAKCRAIFRRFFDRTTLNYYYYNPVYNSTSWRKPYCLRKLEFAPYMPPPYAASKCQNLYHLWRARQKSREAIKSQFQKIFDRKGGYFYYAYNGKSQLQPRQSWIKPRFLGAEAGKTGEKGKGEKGEVEVKVETGEGEEGGGGGEGVAEPSRARVKDSGRGKARTPRAEGDSSGGVFGFMHFTEEMNARLLEGVEKFGRNWVRVAAYVGGGVASKQCNMRYTRNVDPALQELNNGPWTDEEFELLESLVEKYATTGHMGGIDWAPVAWELGRSTKKGPFSPEEDAIIVARVAAWDTNERGLWSSLERELGRGGDNIRHRWTTILSMISESAMEESGSKEERSGSKEERRRQKRERKVKAREGEAEAEAETEVARVETGKEEGRKGKRQKVEASSSSSSSRSAVGAEAGKTGEKGKGEKGEVEVKGETEEGEEGGEG
ncbi:hypothetical protein B484DRAFT_390935, partial [Ochromonadaceae sp. CCMP2298]